MMTALSIYLGGAFITAAFTIREGGHTVGAAVIGLLWPIIIPLGLADMARVYLIAWWTGKTPYQVLNRK